MKSEIYRGFQITPIFIYGNGTADFEYYKIDDPEVSGLIARGTVEKVKSNIDEYENEYQTN